MTNNGTKFRSIAIEANAEKLRAAELARMAEQEAMARQIESDSQEARDRLKEVLVQAETAARSGEFTCIAQVRSWVDKDDLSSAQSAAAALRDALIAEGLDARVETGTMEPVGSDPMFYETVYNISVVVTW